METPATIETPRKTRGDAVNLRPFEADLDQWLCIEEMTFAQAAQKLAETHGTNVSTKVLWRWLKKHNAQKLRQTILRNITSGAQAMRQLRDHAARHEIPQLEELMGLLRVITANLATRPDAAVKTEAIVSLLRPVIEHAKLQQREQQLGIDRMKLEILQRRAARDEEAEKTMSDSGMSAEQKMAKFREIFGIAA